MFDELTKKVNDVVESFLVDAVMVTDAKLLNLDYRAGYMFYVADEFICVLKSQVRALEYYGGFEYIDSDYKFVAGEYVFYNAENSRVAECLEYFFREAD